MIGPTPGHVSKRALFWTKAMIFILGANSNLVAANGNFQSGRSNGAFYAGGMDFSSDYIYATGMSYATNSHYPSTEGRCFVSKFRTDSLTFHEDNISGLIGWGNEMHACHAIGLMHDSNNPSSSMQTEDIVVAGTDDNSGGFIFDVDAMMKDLQQVSRKFKIHDDEPNTVSYPGNILYVANQGTPNDEIYVTSLVSFDKTPNPSIDTLIKQTDGQPNYLEYYKYGSNFQIRVQKFNSNVDSSGNTLITEIWRTDFQTTEALEGESSDVFFGGSIYKAVDSPMLIVAGSTKGTGPAYGSKETGSDDVDGFITVLSAESGKFRLTNQSIRVGTTESDLILGICDDPNDANHFYIVGSTGDPHGMGDQVREHHMVLTTAEGSLHGFIQKRRVDDLERVWGVTWGAKSYDAEDETITTAGVDCKVLDDGILYVAGVVEKGGHVMRDPQVSLFGDNFVAMSLQSETGEVNWVMEHGSSDGNENLARSGAIVVEPKTNNMILFGETTGSLFRHREDPSDILSNIFLMNIAKEDGRFSTEMSNSIGNVGSVESHHINEAQHADLTDEQIAAEVEKGKMDGLSDAEIIEKINNVEEGLTNHVSGEVEEKAENMLSGGDGNQAQHADLTDEQIAREVAKGKMQGLSDAEIIEKINNVEEALTNHVSDEVEKKAESMLSGGDWKDDEVYGHEGWYNKNGLGVQTGPSNGSVFAGGMVYDSGEDTAYLTGIAYEYAGESMSSCMVTKIPLESTLFRGFYSATGKIIGKQDVLEVCSSVALHGYTQFVSVGNADVGSSVLDREQEAMLGFAMALDRYTLENVDTTVLSSNDNQYGNIEYPVDLISDGNNIYIISLISNDGQLTPEFTQVTNSDGVNNAAPNWINMHKYGSSLRMSVTKLELAQQTVQGVGVGDVTFTQKWKSNFQVKPDPNTNTIPSVFLGGAILNQEKGYLTVSGSTRGAGEGYGEASQSEDLFVTFIDTNTGALSTTLPKNNIRQGTDRDDLVLGMCHDPLDDTAFYIVGGTKGLIGEMKSDIREKLEQSMDAFVMKVNAVSQKTEWTVQVGAIHKWDKSRPSTSKAFDCAVRDGIVFTAGVVDDGAMMMQGITALNSLGGDDVWLGSFDTRNGHLNWLRQMGSAGNDHVAPRGAIAINKKGNILLFGDTNGEFFRIQSEAHKELKLNELFLMEITKGGQFQPHVHHRKHVETDLSFVDVTPTEADIFSTEMAPSPASITHTAPPFLVDQTKINQITKPKKLSTAAKTTLIIVSVATFLILVGSFTFYFLKKKGQKPLTTPHIYIQNGLITVDHSQEFATTPPLSTFKEHFSDNLHQSAEYLEDVQLNGKEII
eukprot:CAMPEP_0197196372 /NCGR_PEP_ID=MMETSP1423-20130617/32323_1 /TAXON_ID=476441 /ORGANISM="Pseudo-nitzschia heimii, Strain UNC1101" /LENGTH=1332 /DNA_ID=CAMNT_0042650171 /DNA_START=103 /DNA_END=4101 /DNA_ORIENTATION=+